MNDKVKEEVKDPRVPLGYLSQAWTDIRSYNSLVWQISAVSLSILFLGLNLWVNSVSSGAILPNEIIILVVGGALVFSTLTYITISWLIESITKRTQLILNAESKLIDIMGESLVIPIASVFEQGWIPLQILLVIFQSLTIFLILDSVFILVQMLLAITGLLDLLVTILILIFLLILSILSTWAGYSMILRIRRRNEWIWVFTRELSEEMRYHPKLRAFANKFGYRFRERNFAWFFGEDPGFVDARILTKKIEIPVWYRKYEVLNKRFWKMIKLHPIGVIITTMDEVREEVKENRTYFIIGLHQDFDRIHEFITKKVPEQLR